MTTTDTRRRDWRHPLGAARSLLGGLFEKPPLRAWRREHVGLRAHGGRLPAETWRVVERIEACDREDRAARRGRRALAAFEHRLAVHLAHEEGTGHLAEALEAAPRYRNNARKLLAEHEELLLEMRRIRDLALEAGVSAEAWAEVHRACGDFAERLFAHDEAENEIMVSAFLDDLGEGG